MNKHTFAPWRVNKRSQASYQIEREHGVNQIEVIADALTEANARLIAAAPDLLEALYQLVDAADDSDGCQYGTLSTAFVRDIARAAIAKATGEKE